MGKIVTSLNELTIPAGNFILVLPGWYPTWVDPMPGDFNQRHVLAAALYVPQVVLYIGKDTANTIKNITVQYHQVNENLVEIIVLYPQEKWKTWDVIQSHATYVKLLYKYADLVKRQWGLPSLLHCYIVMRGGLSGWLLSKQWKLPYILTENWTIYYPADPGYLQNRNIVFRSLVKKIFYGVARFLPVTQNLDEQVRKLVGPVSSTVIPNVVDTDLFFYDDPPRPVNSLRFIHVSTMEYQKNPEGLLRAFKAFLQKRPGSVLIMVGPYPAAVYELAKSLKLTEGPVSFIGSVTYQDVATNLKASDALVLFSRYENLPCVILESLCCGIPVISTAVGGVSEVIDETNGIIIASENEEQLQQAFEDMEANYSKYDRKKIAETSVDRFSYSAVGHQINEVYKQLIKP